MMVAGVAFAEVPAFGFWALAALSRKKRSRSLPHAVVASEAGADGRNALQRLPARRRFSSGFF